MDLYEVLDHAFSIKGTQLRVLVQPTEIVTSLSGSGDSIPYMVTETFSPVFLLSRHLCMLEENLSLRLGNSHYIRRISPLLEDTIIPFDALSKGLISPIPFLGTSPNHRGVGAYHEHGKIQLELFDSQRETTCWSTGAHSFSEALKKLSRRAWWNYYFGI